MRVESLHTCPADEIMHEGEQRLFQGQRRGKAETVADSIASYSPGYLMA